jgi:putative selenate reductase
MESQTPGVFVIGDARRGPASIISAEADGRDAAFAIIRSMGKEPERLALPKPRIDREALSRRGELLESLTPDNPDFAEREADRCLSCGAACLRCVEVCPNRANIALPISEQRENPAQGHPVQAQPVQQGLQIIHIDDLCNQCGNCGFFCPYDGNPYEEKPTLFSSAAALEQSTNPGFVFLNPDKQPAILYRPAQPGTTGEASLEKLDFEAWKTRTATDPLLFLAWQIFTEHSYLIPLQREDL